MMKIVTTGWTFFRRIQQHTVASESTEAVHRWIATLRVARSLTKRVLSKGWSVLWRSGVLTAFLIVALVLLAMAQLGVYALAWTVIGPTDNYVTNRWLSMVFPAAVGLVVGISIAWRNWKAHRAQSLNGLENLARSTAGALAAYIQVYMGVAAVRLVVESSMQSAKENIPDGLTPETIQPYFEVSFVETLLLAGGIYATVEITRRACLMRKPNARTARAQLRVYIEHNVAELKVIFTGRRAKTQMRQKSYRRAQRRLNSVWNNNEKLHNRPRKT